MDRLLVANSRANPIETAMRLRALIEISERLSADELIRLAHDLTIDPFHQPLLARPA